MRDIHAFSRGRVRAVLALATLLMLAPTPRAQVCDAVAAVEKLGLTGSPGSVGTPVLTLQGPPVIDAPFSGLRVEHGLPGAPGLILFSASSSPVTLNPFGATLYPSLPLQMLNFQLDADGGRSFAAPPGTLNPLTYCGAGLVLQVALADAGVPGGFALSAGLELRYGRASTRPLFPSDKPATGTLPAALASGDLNGDGRPDLAVVNRGFGSEDPSLSILLGAPDGGFELAQHHPLDPNPRAVGIADFTGDGEFDVVVTHFSLAHLTLFPGDGEGQLGAPSRPSAPHGATSLAILDLNQDGFADLAINDLYDDTANPSDDLGARVLFGSGTGSFSPSQLYPTEGGSRHVTAADINADGHLDVAVHSGDFDPLQTVSMLRGLGDGSLSEVALHSFPGLAGPIRFADLDADGLPELIGTANDPSQGSVMVIPNHGHWAFGSAVVYPPAVEAQALRVGDVNHDGVPDVAVTSDGGVALLLGVGDGTLALAAEVEAFSEHDDIVFVDTNADGDLDLVFPNYWTHDLSVVLGAGDGTLQPQAAALDVGPRPRGVALGDVNADGVPDLASALLGADGVSVALGLGDGSFGPATAYATPTTARTVIIEDINGDGFGDVTVGCYPPNRVAFWLSDGAGGFTDGGTHTFGNSSKTVLLRDLDGDDVPDLVSAAGQYNTVTLALGDGDGGFDASSSYIAGASNQPQGSIERNDVAVGDVNGDGLPDLVSTQVTTDKLSVLLGTGGGAFEFDAWYDTGSEPHAVALGDVTGDGLLDAVTADAASDTVSVFVGMGDGGFWPASPLQVGSSPEFVELGDVNGDGLADIVVVNVEARDVWVLPALGSGTFGEARHFRVGALPRDLALADLDGDGMLDIVTANLDSEDVSVLLNRFVNDE